jgi:hypothetical protein
MDEKETNKKYKRIFVYVHGNHGDTTHLLTLVKKTQNLFDDQTLILNSDCNSSDTHIGGNILYNINIS